MMGCYIQLRESSSVGFSQYIVKGISTVLLYISSLYLRASCDLVNLLMIQNWIRMRASDEHRWREHQICLFFFFPHELQVIQLKCDTQKLVTVNELCKTQGPMI